MRFHRILSPTSFLKRTFFPLYFLGVFVSAAVLADEDTDDVETQEAAIPAEQKVRVGGALRFNAFHKSWDEANQDQFGEIDFDTFRINVDAEHKDITASIEYRFYAGYNMLHHGYFGYEFDNEVGLEFGVSRKPFGLMPYASHNWFFNLTYYLGMEDDHDLGLKVIMPMDDFELQLAFYKTDEGHYTGDSIDSARYSYDIVQSDQSELGSVGVTEPRTNEEVNQFNGRLIHTRAHSDSASTELGISGEYGGIYNHTTEKMGHHWAAALHMNGIYGRYNLNLQAIQTGFSPQHPSGPADRFIVMGAYDAPYKVAAEGSIFLAGLAYTLPTDWGPVESLTFYNDYSYLLKSESQFKDSQQNVLGMLVAAGPLVTYVDFAFGKNQPWIGPDYGQALAEGNVDDDWGLRFNINIGYYF